MAGQFQLSDEERWKELPSGGITRFEVESGWARTNLKEARLIEYTGRGKYRITTRGLDVLASKPLRIGKPLLRQFAEFRPWESSALKKRKVKEQQVTMVI